MGTNTKVLLVGSPTYMEVAQALGSAFDIDVKITPSSSNEFVWLNFADPNPDPKADQDRQMTVFENTVDDKNVYEGPATWCSLGAFGSSVEIATALAERFGGYVCASDSLEEWVFVESVSPEVDHENLSPEDAFNISVSRILPVKVAAALRDAIADPFVRESLTQAVDELREAKESQLSADAARP